MAFEQEAFDFRCRAPPPRQRQRFERPLRPKRAPPVQLVRVDISWLCCGYQLRPWARPKPYAERYLNWLRWTAMHNARLRAVIGLLAVSLLTWFSVPPGRRPPSRRYETELR